MSDKTAEHAALAAGSRLAVVFADGTSREVHVRQCRVRELDAFIAAMDREAALVALCVPDLKPEEVDNLSIASFAAVIDRIDKVNADFFVLFERKLRNLRRVDPEFTQRVTAAAGAGSNPSPNGLPMSRRPSG
jgi:hypothetical protein